MNGCRARILGVALVLTLPVAALCDGIEEAGPPADPAFVEAKQAIEEQRWEDAARLLKSAALRDTRNADIQNYLGYAHRRLGRFDEALTYYDRALLLDPRHRGAHEYLGEAYLQMDNPAKAEEHLAALERICVLGCTQADELRRAIAEYRRRGQ